AVRGVSCLRSLRTVPSRSTASRRMGEVYIIKPQTVKNDKNRTNFPGCIRPGPLCERTALSTILLYLPRLRKGARYGTIAKPGRSAFPPARTVKEQKRNGKIKGASYDPNPEEPAPSVVPALLGDLSGLVLCAGLDHHRPHLHHPQPDRRPDPLQRVVHLPLLQLVFPAGGGDGAAVVVRYQVLRQALPNDVLGDDLLPDLVHDPAQRGGPAPHRGAGGPGQLRH